MRPLIASLSVCVLAACTLMAQDDVATGPGSTPVSMRVIGVTLNADSMHVRALLLDSNGTMVRLLDGTGSWTVSTRCRTEYATTMPAPVRISERVIDEVPATCMVVVNNSLLEGAYPRTVVTGLSSMLRRMADMDSVGVMLFDEGSYIIAPLSSPVSAADALNAGIENPDGLGAVYSALSSALSAVSTQMSGPRAIVLITSSDDNASVVHTPAEIVRSARRTGVAIHVVRIGANSQGYVYRYIAQATGGRLITIEPANVDDIGTIVRDIIKGMHRYHALAIAAPSPEPECADVWVQAAFTLPDRRLSDSLLVPMQDRTYHVPNLVVATFPDDEDASLRRSYNTLATLSELMLSDSTINIELVGHSSPGPGKEATTKGLRRAQAVSDLLVAYGVPAVRIRVRTDGSARPLFYFQQSEAQRALNNRVELRWVVGDDLPFTVTAEEVVSEEQAIKAVDKWEERGYKAYFDPVVSSDGPAYRIRLWGYETFADAKRAANDARKRFKVKAAAD